MRSVYALVYSLLDLRLAGPGDWLYRCIVRPGAAGCGAAWLDPLPLPVAALRYLAPFGGHTPDSSNGKTLIYKGMAVRIRCPVLEDGTPSGF